MLPLDCVQKTFYYGKTSAYIIELYIPVYAKFKKWHSYKLTLNVHSCSLDARENKLDDSLLLEASRTFTFTSTKSFVSLITRVVVRKPTWLSRKKESRTTSLNVKSNSKEKPLLAGYTLWQVYKTCSIKTFSQKSLTFILYYAWQRNRKYKVRVMCVLHTIFFMHLSDCKAAAVISDIWLQVHNRPFAASHQTYNHSRGTLCSSWRARDALEEDKKGLTSF